MDLEFPQSFIQSNGRLLIELISFLTGKKVPVLSATITNFSKPEILPAGASFV